MRPRLNDEHSIIRRYWEGRGLGVSVVWLSSVRRRQLARERGPGSRAGGHWSCGTVLWTRVCMSLRALTPAPVVALCAALVCAQALAGSGTASAARGLRSCASARAVRAQAGSCIAPAFR